MTTIRQLAQYIALEQHAGTINKHDGELYLLHVARVATGARTLSSAFGADPDIAEAVGWLHDTVEDTDITLSLLQERISGVTSQTVVEEIIQAVRLLTKVQGQTLEDYYTQIAANGLASCIKTADISDNFGRNHLIKDDATRLRMGKKYSLGMDILGGSRTFK